MRRLRELLRLKYGVGLSPRAIAQACTVGLGTVTTYLQRATAAGLTWPLPDELDDAALEARVFARPAGPPARDRVVPDWVQLHQEPKKPGVTLALLWLEYRGAHPSGYAYSQFCERYRRWARRSRMQVATVQRPFHCRSSSSAMACFGFVCSSRSSTAIPSFERPALK